jgi:hypothetical protein
MTQSIRDDHFTEIDHIVRLFDLDDHNFALLKPACSRHTHGEVRSDILLVLDGHSDWDRQQSHRVEALSRMAEKDNLRP